MYPSSRSTRAISSLSREEGTRTSGWRALLALRIRVSMSAIGSETTPIVWVAVVTAMLLPAALGHAGHAALGGEVAEADAAHAELAHERARTTADPAPVVKPHLELRLPLPTLDG